MWLWNVWNWLGKKNMNISGKIYKINEINKDITSVVLLKTRKKKPYYVQVLFYYHLSDLVKEKYKESDFIKIWYRLRSNKRETEYGEKFYTDVIGEKIVLVRREGMDIQPLYNEYNLKVKNKYVNKESGEIIDTHTVQNAIQNNPNRDW